MGPLVWYMLTLDSRDTCGIIIYKRNWIQKSCFKISKISIFQMIKKGKGKFVCLFYTDIYERKRVRFDPQISRESPCNDTIACFVGGRHNVRFLLKLFINWESFIQKHCGLLVRWNIFRRLQEIKNIKSPTAHTALLALLHFLHRPFQRKWNNLKASILSEKVDLLPQRIFVTKNNYIYSLNFLV